MRASPREYGGSQGSAVLKIFDMTAATTGLNEKSAAAAGIDYDKAYTYSASHASYYPGGANMSVKALWDKKTLRLIGAQIVGFDGVDKRMDVLATAIRFGAKITDLTSLELCYAPPFGSAKDPVNMLGYVGENIVTGKVRQLFWHDVQSLPRDGSATLLDVRTLTETARGRIDGFVHIPLTRCGSVSTRYRRTGRSMCTATAGCAAISPAVFLRAAATRATTLPAAGGCTSRSSMSAPFPNIYVRSAFKAKAAPAPFAARVRLLFQWQMCPPQPWLPQPCSPQACPLPPCACSWWSHFTLGS